MVNWADDSGLRGYWRANKLINKTIYFFIDLFVVNVIDLICTFFNRDIAYESSNNRFYVQNDASGLVAQTDVAVHLGPVNLAKNSQVNYSPLKR